MSPQARRALAAGLVVVALLVAAVWRFGSRHRGPDTDTESGTGSVSEAEFKAALEARGRQGTTTSESAASTAATAAVEATGRVRMADGAGISGATVVGLDDYTQVMKAPWLSGLPRTTTDADGRFRLARTRVPRLIAAWKEGFALRVQDVEVAKTSTEIVLSPEVGRIRGTVRDEDGAPIPGARLVAGEYWMGVGFGTTGPDGAFSIGRRSTGPVGITAWADGFAPEGAQVGRGVDRIDIVLVRAVLVSGRVVDAGTGEGLAGARVGPCLDFDEAVVAGADGRFEAYDDLRSPRARVRATAPGYEEGQGAVERAADGRATVEVRLRRFAMYRGHVLDEAGSPLSGAHVQVLKGGRATSRADGSFEVGGPEVGSKEHRFVALVASAGERMPAVEKVEGTRRDGITLRLGPPIPLVGRVVDGDGAPRPRAVVWISTNGGRHWDQGVNALAGIVEEEYGGITLAVDEQGRFRAAGLPEGVYSVQARPTLGAGWGVFVKATIARDRAPPDLTIEIVEGVTLAGLVLDAEGRPVSDAPVSFQVQRGSDRVQRDTSTNEEGRFRLEGVEDRPGTLRVTPEDFESWQGEVDPHDGEVRVRLKPLVSVRVRLRFEGHVPPDGTVVQVMLTHERNGRGATGVISNGEVTVERKGSLGTYEVSAQLPGWYSEEVRVDVQPGVRESVVRVRLQETLTIEGTVRGVGGEAIAGAQVRAMPMGGLMHPEPVETDREGRFRLGDLTPGQVRLLARAPDRGFVSKDVKAGDTGVELRIQPAAPPTPQLKAPPPPGLTIRGRVVLPSEESAHHVMIFARPANSSGGQQATVVASEDGTFELVGLAAEPYELRAIGDGAVGRLSDVQAGSQGVELRMVRVGQVRGRVQGIEGTEAQVVFRDPGDGSLSHQGTTKPDGRFAIDSVAPGTYVVWARAGELVSARGIEIVVAAGEIVRDVEIPLVRGGRIEGTFRAKDGAAVAGAPVTVESVVGVRPSHVDTDAGGRFQFVGLAAGTWRVRIHGGASGSQDREVVVGLGATVVADFTAP